MEPPQNAESTPNQNSHPSLKEKYQFAISARQFHYDNYNKWMTYFYVAMAALLVALYTIATEPESDQFKEKQFYLTAVHILGFCVSMLWYLSSKGYYYWNLNFISIINHYEITLFGWKDTEKVYSAFANKEKHNNYCSPISAANISTSKSAILFAFLVTLFWGTILVHHWLYEAFTCPQENQPYITLLSVILSLISIIVLSTTVGKKYLFSNTDYMVDLKVNLPNRTKE